MSRLLFSLERRRAGKQAAHVCACVLACVPRSKHAFEVPGWSYPRLCPGRYGHVRIKEWHSPFDVDCHARLLDDLFGCLQVCCPGRPGKPARNAAAPASKSSLASLPRAEICKWRLCPSPFKFPRIYLRAVHAHGAAHVHTCADGAQISLGVGAVKRKWTDKGCFWAPVDSCEQGSRGSGSRDSQSGPGSQALSPALGPTQRTHFSSSVIKFRNLQTAHSQHGRSCLLAVSIILMVIWEIPFFPPSSHKDLLSVHPTMHPNKLNLQPELVKFW